MNNITMQPQFASPAIKFAATAKAAPATRTAEVKFAGKENKGISVQSSAIVEKDPDTLGVQLYLQEQGASEREVNDAIHTRSEALVRAVKDLNIDGLTMKTTFSPVNPMYDYGKDRSKKPTITGYQGNFNIQLHVTDRNSDKLPEAAAKLKTLATEKEVQFNGPQYGLKDRDEAVLEALEKAVQKAKAQAERLARAAGLQVQDKPAHIEVGASNDYGSPRGGMRMAAMSMESAGGGASAESFQYEPSQVSSPNIVVRFAFKHDEPTP